jgi:hypothetical protein
MEKLIQELKECNFRFIKEKALGNGLSEQLRIEIWNIVNNQIKDCQITRDNRLYNIIGHEVFVDFSEYKSHLNDVKITLHYLINEPENSIEINKLKWFHKNYNWNSKQLPWLDKKKFGNLWFEDQYTIKIDDISNNIKLQIPYPINK